MAVSTIVILGATGAATPPNTLSSGAAFGTASVIAPSNSPAGVQRGGRVGGQAHRLARRCPDHRAGVRYYRQQTKLHAARRGVEVRHGGRKPRSCQDARYLAIVARSRARRQRTLTEQWEREHVLRDFPVCANCNAWRRAVAEAQRPYPGTSGWLLSCSSSEGGWGRWVPNSQGSGVGGWLQFYPSTFARMYSAAKYDLARRAFIVPASAASWYSPLGQALAGAWGLTHGRRHEWHGAGC